MSIVSQNVLANSNSRILHFTNSHLSSRKSPDFFLPWPCKRFSNLSHFQTVRTRLPSRCNSNSSNTHHWPPKAFAADDTVEAAAVNFVLDGFLSVLEFLCLASSAVISVAFAVNSALSSSQKPIFAWLGNRVFLFQFVLLVGAVAIGASIRRRQWRRICTGGSGVNSVKRIEKLEEDFRSSATIIRVLSRQLEKLGIRFRVTRKNLKQPIAETAALAQKNADATRSLAVREDNLERELSEIQRVLLAMQEQQQKQLQLILEIGKTSRLWDRNRGHKQEGRTIEICNSAEGDTTGGKPRDPRAGCTEGSKQ